MNSLCSDFFVWIKFESFTLELNSFIKLLFPFLKIVRMHRTMLYVINFLIIILDWIFLFQIVMSKIGRYVNVIQKSEVQFFNRSSILQNWSIRRKRNEENLDIKTMYNFHSSWYVIVYFGILFILNPIPTLCYQIDQNPLIRSLIKIFSFYCDLGTLKSTSLSQLRPVERIISLKIFFPSP